MAQVVKGLPYVDEVIPFDRLGWKKQGKLKELFLGPPCPRCGEKHR